MEEFFFHRIKAGRPICVPNSGLQVAVLLLCLALYAPSKLAAKEVDLLPAGQAGCQTAQCHDFRWCGIWHDCQACKGSVWKLLKSP